MKLTEEQIEEIQRQFALGIKPYVIAKNLGLCYNTTYYWCGNRKKMIRNAVERYKRKSPEEKKKDYEKNKEYYAKYFKERYKYDVKFREKHKALCRVNSRKNYVPKKG